MSRTTKYGPRGGRPPLRPSMLNLRGRHRTCTSLIREALRPRKVGA
jgi:hypothetical protein